MFDIIGRLFHRVSGLPKRDAAARSSTLREPLTHVAMAPAGREANRTFPSNSSRAFSHRRECATWLGCRSSLSLNRAHGCDVSVGEKPAPFDRLWGVANLDVPPCRAPSTRDVLAEAVLGAQTDDPFLERRTHGLGNSGPWRERS